MSAPQGTAEWLQEKCGCASASEFHAVLAKGEGKTRGDYLARVVAERLTGKPAETYRNGHMDRGTEQEPFARLAYEAKFGEPVEQVGFIRHAALMAGCSPDGLLGKNGGGEFKCVIPTVQLETWRKGGCPAKHKAQVQGNLWITGRDWWDFTSFSPDMPSHLRLYVHRVYRDEPYIQTLEAEVRRFLGEADELYERLMKTPAIRQAA